MLAAAMMALGFATVGTAPASAMTVVATYTGTISSGYDQTGVFGTPGADLAGDAYVARYTFDTTKGYLIDTLPGGYEEQYGGFNYNVSSPVSATLTINGVTQSDSGDQTSAAYTQPSIPPFGIVSDQAEQHDPLLNGDTYSSMLNFASDVYQPTLTTPIPLTNTYAASGFFLFYTYNDQLGYTSYADGAFGPVGTVQISVPEPAAWAMMLIGFCGLGARLRRFNRRAAPAV